MRVPSEGDQKALEALIDQIGLYETLSLIEVTCADKADHIRSSYAESSIASLWDKAGASITDASEGFAVQRLNEVTK